MWRKNSEERGARALTIGCAGVDSDCDGTFWSYIHHFPPMRTKVLKANCGDCGNRVMTSSSFWVLPANPSHRRTRRTGQTAS